MNVITRNMVLGQDGTLAIRKKGQLCQLGITPGELRAMVRSSVKSDTLSQREFKIGSERFLQGADSKSSTHITHVEKKIFSGNSNVYKAFDLTVGKKGILKIEKDPKYQSNEKTSSVEELEMYLYLNSPDDPCDGIIPAPHLCFNIGQGESATIGLFMKEQKRGTLEENLSLLSTQQRLKGVLNLARGVQRLNERKVLHADIKPENVYVNNKGEIRHADFDKVWKLGSADELLANIMREDSKVPASSDNAKHPGDFNRLEDIGRNFQNKIKEIETKKNEIKAEKRKGFIGIGKDGSKIKSLENDLEILNKEKGDIFNQYYKCCEGLHTCSFAFLAFQVLTGCAMNTKENLKDNKIEFQIMKGDKKDIDNFKMENVPDLRSLYDEKVKEIKSAGASDEEISLLNKLKPLIISTLNTYKTDSRMNLNQAVSVMQSLIDPESQQIASSPAAAAAGAPTQRRSRRLSIGSKEGARLSRELRSETPSSRSQTPQKGVRMEEGVGGQETKPIHKPGNSPPPKREADKDKLP